MFDRVRRTGCTLNGFDMKIVDKDNMASIISRIKAKFVAQKPGMGLSENDLTDERKYKVDFNTLFVDLTYTFGQRFEEFSEALAFVIGDVISAGGWNISGVSVIAYADSGATMHYFRRITPEDNEAATVEGWEELGVDSDREVVITGPYAGSRITQSNLDGWGLTKPVLEGLFNSKYDRVKIVTSTGVYGGNYAWYSNGSTRAVVLFFYSLSGSSAVSNYRIIETEGSSLYEVKNNIS